MNLTSCELKKIICNPIVWIALAAVIILNAFTILIGGEQSQYAANAPAFRTNIQELQERSAYFAGPITQEWIDRFQLEAEAILNESGIAEYNRYEDIQVAANFYVNALNFGDQMADYYLEKYPGAKGEALADDTRVRYNYLASEYTANYNYDYGYQKIRNMMTLYPYTIGVVILIALAPIFSSEYSKRTDALLLTSKNGKKKVVRAKLRAGLLAALGIWAIVTLLNIVVIFSLYGITGWEAFWQNWIIDVAPFPWVQGEITVVAIATSLIGALFFALILMLVSSFSKNQFISIIVGAIILLFPMLDFAFTSNAFVNMLYNFLPSRLMMGVRIWQGFDLFYFAGIVIPYQYVAIVTSILVSALLIPVTTHFFIRHQVEN